MPRQLATNRQLATGRVLQRDTGGCIKFSSNSDYVQVPNIPALIPGTQGFGCVYWLNLQSYPNSNNILVQYNSGSYALGWLMSAVLSQDRISVYVQNGAPSAQFAGLARNLLNRKVRIGFRVSAVDRIIRLYVNGVLYGSSAPIAAWNITANGAIRFGSSADLTGSPIAQMDDVCLFVGEATDQDFANDYFNNIQIPGSVTRHGFEEQTETSAADSISGNTATLSNSNMWSSEKFMGLRAAIPETMNMNRYSEDLSNAAWTKNAGVTATLTTEVPLPAEVDQQNTQISKVVYDGSGVAGGARILQAIESNTAVGITYSNGFWARTLSGSIDLRYTDNATLTYTPFTVTSAWQFFPFLNLTTTTVAQLQSTISSVSGDNTSFTIYITQWQKTKSSTLPPYLKTTSTAQTTWRSIRNLISNT